MRPPFKPDRALAAGLLAALGLCGTARLDAAGPQDPRPDAPAPTAPASDAAPAPIAPPSPTPPPAVDPDAPPTVLLLTNGRVLRGEVRKTAAGYVLKGKIGVSVYPRPQVEGVFRSMAEAYAHKKAACAENDPDERMKLAMWCLEQKLKAEAKVELTAVLELSPENRRVKAMLANLDPAPMRDDSVQRTAGTVDIPPAEPAELNLDRLRDDYARNPRPSNLPVIFDLDAPLAVRKYQEFAANVHPILQRRCARCHNEANPGDFPLIQTRAKRDLSNDLILRANLEATLKLVSREDLARSPILMASGMTHGDGGKPVLGGSNTAEYRAVAAWVTGLHPIGSKAPPAPAGPAGRNEPSDPPTEGFASGRRRGVPADPAMPPAADVVKKPARSPRTHPGQALSPEELVPPELRDENREVIDAPTPRPGTPGDDQFVPGPVPGSPDYAKAARRASKAPASKGDDEPAEPGKLAPGMIELPGGGFAPVVTKDMTLKKKDDPAKKKKFDDKVLNGFIKARPPAK